MLNYTNPETKRPDQVAIFTRDGSGFCAKTRALLKDLGHDYAQVKLSPV